MANEVAAAGWFGKLPTLGDFATRGLDPDLVAFWDDWLSRGLEQLRATRPDDWLQTYLDCPSWCFVLMPGALPAPWGTHAHAGVLMPSVDRVGRYFPLTLWQTLGPGPWAGAQWRPLWAHLARMNDIAASAVHDDWAPQVLDEQLARLGRPEVSPATASIALPGGMRADEWLALEALGLWWQHGLGRALWFSGVDPDRPRAWMSDGLPALASDLFDASTPRFQP